MSLSEIQFKEALEGATIEILKDGKVPSLSRLVAETQKRLPDNVITPTMRVRLQRYREAWDLLGMNTMFNELTFDLKVMYKALIELADKTLNRLNLVETSTRSQHAQMDRIEGLARNLLFVIQDGDGHFDAFFDDFHDYSKIDLVQSSRDIVDLKSQTAELPDSSPNTRKLNLEHLHSAAVWPTAVNADSRVVRSETPSDAPFRNMFLDTISMWRHDVITEEAGPSSVTFTIPVHRIKDAELSISRVQLIGVSEFVQRAEVTYSVDGINFLKFPNTEGVVELEKSNRAVNIDFPLTRVELIRVTLYRSQQDRSVESGYLTSFGLRHFALYSIGRSFNGVLISKPFTVDSVDKDIEKISLSVFEEIPPGCDIKYYVGALTREENDEDEPEINGTWTPITPVGRTKKVDEPPRVLRMSTLSDKTKVYVPKTPLTAHITYKGIDFYQINSATDIAAEALIEDSVVYGSAQLLRGKNAWLRKKNSDQSLFRVENNFISFSTGPRQKLYTTAQETVPFSNTLKWNETERSTIEVTRPIDFRPEDGMSLVVKGDNDPYSVPDPVHAIYEITLVAGNVEQTEAITFPSTGTGKVKFTAGPIDIKEQQETVEYLSAYRPNLGTHDDSLIEALEARSTLASFHGKTIKNMVSLSTPADVAAGKPQLTRFTIGNHDTAAVVQDRTIDGEVIESTPTPATSQRDLSELSDDQILALFGKVKLRTTYLHGITGVSASDPTKTYEPGTHFQLEVIDNPVTGVPELYVSISPANTARAYSIAAGETVNFKFKYKKDLTPHVLAVEGNRIYLDTRFPSFTGEDSGFRVKVGYRFVPIGTNEVLKESLRVYNQPGGTPYTSGRDYHFNPVDGTITIIPSGAIRSIDGKTAAYASFTHKGALNALDTFSTWVFIPSRDPIKIYYPRLEVNSEFGEKILISTGSGSTVDISNTTETPELSFGWHQVTVLSRDPDIYQGSAIRKVAELKDLDDQPVFLAGGDYFSSMLGTRVPMTQVPETFLLNSILPGDGSKFAITTDGRVLVNFQPNTQKNFYTYGFRTVGTTSFSDQATFYNEEFTLTYKYHRSEARTVNGVVLKAVLSRTIDSSPSITPKLGGYQIRVG